MSAPRQRKQKPIRFNGDFEAAAHVAEAVVGDRWDVLGPRTRGNYMALIQLLRNGPGIDYVMGKVNQLTGTADPQPTSGPEETLESASRRAAERDADVRRTFAQPKIPTGPDLSERLASLAAGFLLEHVRNTPGLLEQDPCGAHWQDSIEHSLEVAIRLLGRDAVAAAFLEDGK